MQRNWRRLDYWGLRFFSGAEVRLMGHHGEDSPSVNLHRHLLAMHQHFHHVRLSAPHALYSLDTVHGVTIVKWCFCPPSNKGMSWLPGRCTRLLLESLATNGYNVPTLVAIMAFCTPEAALQRIMRASTILTGQGLEVSWTLAMFTELGLVIRGVLWSGHSLFLPLDVLHSLCRVVREVFDAFLCSLQREQELLSLVICQTVLQQGGAVATSCWQYHTLSDPTTSHSHAQHPRSYNSHSNLLE